MTNLGVMKFDETTRLMYLAEYYPGIPPGRIVENTGFEINVSKAIESKPPADEELRTLRDEVDPQRLIPGARKAVRRRDTDAFKALKSNLPLNLSGQNSSAR